VFDVTEILMYSRTKLF